MKSLRNVAILWAVVCFCGCRSTTRAVLAGRVVDPDDKGLAGVEVLQAERLLTRTDSGGRFTLDKLPAEERVAVSFRAPGFLETTKIFDGRAAARGTGNGNTIVVWPRTPAVVLDATAGGRVTFPAGSVTFPPNALVDPDGQPIAGNVSVSFTAFDVTDPRQIVGAPGDFTARMSDGSVRRLETFGVFEVFVEDPQRRRAELARGQNALVQLAVRARREPPREVGLYSFDRRKGLWLEAGTLQLTQPLELTASLPSLLTTWNADQTLDTTCIKVRVLDCSGADLPQVLVEHIGGEGYSGYSSGVTQPGSPACLAVKRNARADIVVKDPSQPNVKTDIDIATPTHIATAPADCNDPQLCPVKLVMHRGQPGFTDNLDTQDPARWATSSGAGNVTDPNFDVCWDSNHVQTVNGDYLRIFLDQSGCPAGSNMAYTSGEYRTHCFYGHGTYKATIKHAIGDGLLTTFFTYSEPMQGVPWDEIDVEIFGRAPAPGECVDPNDPSATFNTIMQTNYVVNSANHHEKKICLDLDLSQAHEYKFVWSPSDIKWYVDSVLEHTETRGPNADWPAQPGRVLMNLWALDPTGPWKDPGVFTYNGTGFSAEYHSVEFIPAP